MSLSDKVAIVTGAAQGLGRGVVEILLQKGAKVGITDKDNQTGMALAAELEEKFGKDHVQYMECDVTSCAQMKETFQRLKDSLGGLDIVVNNAGVGMEMGDAWETTVDVNLKGTIQGTMLGYKYMRRDQGGRGGVIVNTASMAGIIASPCAPTYVAVSQGIINYSLGCSQNPEWLANGVRINVFAPACVDTALYHYLKDKNNIYMPHVAEKIIEKIGTLKVEEAAEVILELITNPEKTGQVLNISKATGKQFRTFAE